VRTIRPPARIRADARAADEDVQPPELQDRSLDDELLGRGGIAPVSDDDGCALGAQAPRDGRADPAIAAGDDRDLALESGWPYR
jgi:hypothetical protein